MMVQLNRIETAAWRSFLVIWRIGLAQLEPTFKRNGLIHVEYGILAVLADREGEPMSASDLAALAALSQSRLSHRLDSLELRGLIRRASRVEDRRVVDVYLTESGRRLFEAVRDKHNEDVRKLMFDSLTEKEKELLATTLSKIALALTDDPFLIKYSNDPTLD